MVDLDSARADLYRSGPIRPVEDAAKLLDHADGGDALSIDSYYALNFAPPIIGALSFTPSDLACCLQRCSATGAVRCN